MATRKAKHGAKPKEGGKPKKNWKNVIRAAEDKEIEQLQKRIDEEKPPQGSNPLANDFNPSEYQVHYPAARSFSELPISNATKLALSQAKYTQMTNIQRATIPHALAGRDVLGAARTGSGKTLAFVIPLLELLYRDRWTAMDGLGAVIIAPTRELALQIFEVLRTVGKHHTFSAGLVIGGKDLEAEQSHITHMNILVCTPGRLLQHLEQTPGFDVSGLKMVVLDEADRVLDLGFLATLNALIDYLPPGRQTLLFSATQTKSVRDLARLSLRDPEYISVDEAAGVVTPAALTQHVMVCELPDKLRTVWSFVKAHLRAKTIVFFSACKQVRYVHEAFSKMRPGVPLLAIHGKQKQMKRMAIFAQFCTQKHAVLFATDVAARGLDFPAVDWVVQADCPEDVATYIHRAGRTARMESKGHALLLLLPSERKFIEELKAKKVAVEEIAPNPKKLLNIASTLSSVVASDTELKYLAQKAFMSYLRSVFLQKNKDVFDVHALPAEEFAASLGLSLVPKISFTKSKRIEKNQSRLMQLASAGDEESSEAAAGAGAAVNRVTSEVDKMMKRKNTTIMSEKRLKLRATAEESSEEELLRPKKRDVLADDDDEEEDDAPAAAASKRAAKGEEEAPADMEADKDEAKSYAAHLRATLARADPEDKQNARDRRRAKRIAMKERLKAQKREEQARRHGVAVTLGPADDADMADGSDGGEAEGASEREGEAEGEGEAGSDGGGDANLEELEEAAEALLRK